MPAPLLAALDPHRHGDGSRPLPRRRLERVALLTAGEESTVAAIAAACGISIRSVKRVRAHPVVRARVRYLRHQAAERAAEDAPLARRGNRIALLDRLARELARQLADNQYTATVGVNKAGQPIQGFDRGRTAELVKVVLALHDMTRDKPSAQPQTDALAVQATMTTEQAVVKVQALLSRAAPLDPGNPGGHPAEGVGGGMFATGTGAETLRDPARGPQQISDT